MMRLNKYLALYGGLSRRSADKAIEQGRASLNGQVAILGQSTLENDSVTLDGQKIIPKIETKTIMLNKPVGYVCSRNGQGSRTIYDLLPKEFHGLKSIGRLDKDSSGLLLLTNDGQLANRLTHPSYQKTKVYEVTLDRKLTEDDFENITRSGVKLDDGLSKFKLDSQDKNNSRWQVTMEEGRNRQIRRTFETLGYRVIRLHRLSIGKYKLGQTLTGHFSALDET